MVFSVVNHDSVEQLFERAAKDFVTYFEQALSKKEFFDVALSGGSTAKTFFAFLIRELRGHQHLSRIRFFLSDERVVSIDNADSNAGNAQKLLLTPLGISDRQIFPMYDDKSDARACAENYEQLLRSLVPHNNHGVPVLDLVYLGIGQDGHTASLFPHNDLLNDTRHLVGATKENGFPYDRITMMPRLINAATHVVVMAYGPAKAEVINAIVDGEEIPQSLPAQFILRNSTSDVALLTADLTGDL